MENEVTEFVSESRVKECELSAQFWAPRIGLYAERMRKRADRFAITSALLSALTGLGVWSTLAASTQWPAVLVVSLVALAAAAVAIIPQIKGYGVCAEKAASLGPSYGHVLGDLRDALDLLRSGHTDGPARACEAVMEFEAVRAGKEALRPYPADLQAEINELRKARPG